MEESAPMPTCPMAETCKGMMEKPFSGLALVIPGVALILLGALVLIEPRILVWLVAVALILMGVAVLMLSWFMRKIGERLQGVEG